MATKYHVDYSQSLCKPCIKHRCDSFMFLVLVRYGDGPVKEEYECYKCRATIPSKKYPKDNGSS